MIEDAPTPRPPTPEQCRAIVLSLLVVLSVVAATAVIPVPVAAADSATVTLGTTDPSKMTTHNWSITADTASGESLSQINLDYVGTGTNLSAVDAADIEVTIDGTPADVDIVPDNGDDESLPIVLSNPSTVNSGDVVAVNFLNDSIENPSEEATHTGAILLLDTEGALITSGSDSFTIGSGGGGGTGTLEGQVTNASDGTGIESATIEVTDGETLVGSTTTDPDGNYSIDVPAGTYDVSVSHPSYESTTMSGVSVGDGETVTADVTLTEGGEMEADPASVILGSNDPGVMTTHNWSITADTASGEQLNRIQLYYTGSGANFSAAGIDDIEITVDGATVGADSFEDIGDENLSVVLTTPVAVKGGDEVTVNFLADVVENPTIKSSYYASIGLLGSQEVGAISSGFDQFVIGGAGTIDGRVTNSSDGTGIDGAQVQAIDSEGMGTSAVTNATGYYDISVAEGTYDVSVTHQEYDSNTTSGVSVVSGGTTTVDVSLTSAAFSVVDASVEHVSGTEPTTMPTVRSYETNLAGISLVNESHGQDLASLGVASDTELRVNATIQGMTPRQLIGTIHDASWEVTDVDGDRVTVTIVGKPASAQYMLNAPSLDNWPNDGTDQADMKYEQMWDVALDDMEYGGLSAAELEQVNGSILATDAQAFSMPSYDEGPVGEAGTLSIEIGGPHLTVDGTENQGFFEGFIPDAQLDAWNVTNPETELVANYAGSGVDGMTLTSVDGGVEFAFPVHYSAGEVSMTASTPANFDVAIEDTNAPVIEGETLDVNVTIQNTGDATGTQTITLLNSSGSPLDSAEKSIGGGGTTNFNLSWTTGDGDAGDEQLTVVSENDSVAETVTIQQPASFDVSFDTTTATVTEGEELTVDVIVENVGDVTATQDVNLTDFDDTVVDTRSIQLAGGGSRTVTLTWATPSGDNGTDTIAVTSDDDAATRTVTVKELVFDVTIDGTNAPVTEGDVLAVDVIVENKRDATVTQTINLSDFGGTVVDRNESVTLGGSESVSFTLEWDTANGDAGSASVTVTSENGSASRAVTIEAGSSGGAPLPPRSSELAIVDLDATAATVAVGETVSVEVLVENTGTADGKQDLELTASGTVVDAASVPVAADETATVTLSHAFDEPGSYDLAVNGESVGTVDVEATDEDSNTDGDDEADDGAGETGDSEADAAGDEEDRTDGSDDDSTPGFTPFAAILGLLYVALRRTRSMTNRR